MSIELAPRMPIRDVEAGLHGNYPRKYSSSVMRKLQICTLESGQHYDDWARYSTRYMQGVDSIG